MLLDTNSLQPAFGRKTKNMLFPIFFAFFAVLYFSCKKREKAYFVQHLECALPKCWSKYSKVGVTGTASLSNLLKERMKKVVLCVCVYVCVSVCVCVCVCTTGKYPEQEASFHYIIQ